ncbi:MAG: peptide-methionine (S)-S-oxide reductase MsrA [Bacteroidales bacterium]|nr:peptide-methionine (S)-S-oxide reductase MsrA [Candidatus Cryptobacteroides caccocaballi]
MVEKAVEEASKVSLYSFPEDPSIDVAVFACGCFWGTQHQFDKETGVLRTLAGYTGGPEENPSYADVRDHRTHHVEAVIVEFDPKLTDYTKLCQVFFEIHDPAQTDGVGPDLGPQYRSCLFWRTREQKEKAEAVIADLRSRGYEVNTLVLPFERFYVGEEYHQKYYEKTGGEPYCHLRVRKFPK